MAYAAHVDDATNEVPWVVFREQEDAILLHRNSQTYGLPLSLYADRHTIFQNPREPTIAEQLSGVEPCTHLGGLLERLDIKLIDARSPQVERSGCLARCRTASSRSCAGRAPLPWPKPTPRWLPTCRASTNVS